MKDLFSKFFILDENNRTSAKDLLNLEFFKNIWLIIIFNINIIYKIFIKNKLTK